MNIYGKNVVLRAITMNDTDLLVRLINDPETAKMVGGCSFPVSIEGQQKWIAAQVGRTDILRCIVTLKDDEETGLGTVILSDIDYQNGVAQVHIKMDKEIGCGRGYGSDALNAVVDYAFNEMRLNCIYADVLSYNEISQKLFEKNGFIRDGILRSRVYKNGNYVDVYSYSKVKGDMNAK